MVTLSGSRKRGSDRLGGAVRLARRIAGLASIAAAAWWAIAALRRPAPCPPIVDRDYGLRMTPLLPDEHRAAIARELDVAGGIRL